MDTFSLRSLEQSDAGWIADACSDTEIQRWTLVPRPYTPAHAEQFVRDRAGELAVWVITDGRDSRGAGVVSIHRIENGSADIGYWVAPWARRRGAASAAVRLVVREASTMSGVRRVSALIAETNVASRRVAESAGLAPAADDAGTCPDGATQVRAVRHVLDL